MTSPTFRSPTLCVTATPISSCVDIALSAILRMSFLARSSAASRCISVTLPRPDLFLTVPTKLTMHPADGDSTEPITPSTRIWSLTILTFGCMPESAPIWSSATYSLGEQGAQLVVGRARPHRHQEIDRSFSVKQAGLQLPVAGDPDARAVRTELRVVHGPDDLHRDLGAVRGHQVSVPPVELVDGSLGGHCRQALLEGD